MLNFTRKFACTFRLFDNKFAMQQKENGEPIGSPLSYRVLN